MVNIPANIASLTDNPMVLQYIRDIRALNEGLKGVPNKQYYIDCYVQAVTRVQPDPEW